jgi:hypothetical protein
MKATKDAERHLHHFERAMDTFMASSASDEVKDLARMAYDQCALEMSGRMTAATGQARYRRNLLGLIRSPLKAYDLLIKLSTPLTERSTEDELASTCSHELAHIIDAALHGRSSHGPEWRRIHRLMGGDAKRCHNIDTTGLKKPRKRLVIRLKGDDNGREHRITMNRWKKYEWFLAEQYEIVREILIDERGREIKPEDKKPEPVKVAASAAAPVAASKPKKSRGRVVNPDSIDGIPSDEYCWTAAKVNGGNLSWKGIEDAHGLHPANGMTAYRLAQKYKKRMGL